MFVYLRAKFEVSGIIITSFRERQGGCLSHPFTPTQNKPIKSPSRLGIKDLECSYKKRQRNFLLCIFCFVFQIYSVASKLFFFVYTSKFSFAKYL